MPSETAKRNQPFTENDGTTLLPNMMQFAEAKERISKLVKMMDEQQQVVTNNRHLRYTQIDIEAERKSNRIAPDEMYVPQHIIDSNIRREQAKYIAYLSSARRAAILHCVDDPSFDSDLVERDFTNRFWYNGWQLPLYRCVDGMQQNGYGIVELVNDITMPGHLKFQDVAYGDFGYSMDARNIQDCEMVMRRYYFTKTQLVAMANPNTWKFNKEEIEKVVVSSPSGEINDFKETSLYKVEKVMFRKNGVVMVAWSCEQRCGDWLRAPIPLYLGNLTFDTVTGSWTKAFETSYPYYVANYNITENMTIRDNKGRCYMDQDAQEGVSSLMSSFITAHRRASGLYFSKDTESDPNNDAIQQSNVNLRTGAVINARVKQFQLQPPDSSMLSAIQTLAGANAAENSQIDYAATNRKDSRKTATEIQAAQTEAQLLSTIQLALFSTFMKEATTRFFQIVRTRILAGLIKDVTPQMKEMYQRNFAVRPAGDTDVIEKQEKILKMQQTYPVIAQTAAGPLFLNKLLELLFPEDAQVYIGMIQQDNAKTNALASAMHVIQSFVQDPSQLTPQAQQHLPALKQLLQQMDSVLVPQQAQQKQQ